MMTSDKFQLVVYYIMIILTGRFAEGQVEYGNHQNQSKGISRDIYYTTTFDQDISRRGGSSTELPVTFKAPGFGSQNFWNYDPKNEAYRRTFFEDFKYFNYGNSNVFPNLNSFFEFMSPLFDRDSSLKPKQRPVSKLSEPYKYEYPFKYLSSTEKNFLPPPKPLRASIVKLETVTKLPDWQYPYEYVTPEIYPKQVPQFQNHESSKQRSSLYIDELGFNSNNNINFRRDSNLLSQKNPGEIIIPILEDSVEFETTTHRQISEEFNFRENSTSTSLQEPVKKDQWNFNLTPLKNIENTEKGDDKDSNPFSVTELIPIQENIKHTDLEEESKRRLQLVINNTINRYNQIHNLKYNTERNNDTKDEAIDGTVVVKNTKPHKQNTIKIVTDLTLQGLQKSKKETVNVPRYTKFVNITNLINYELNKLKKYTVMKPRSDNIDQIKYKIRENWNDENEKPTTNAEEFSDNNDELSLDLKILKDTNWDGFSNQSVNKFFPNKKVNNLELSTTETDTNWPLLTNGKNNTNILNIENSSIQTFIENKINNENKTIIVETRVTKSVSKVLPEKNRNISRNKIKQNKMAKDNTNHERDPTQEINHADRNKQPNVEADAALNKTEITKGGNVTDSVIEKIKKIHSEDNEKRVNPVEDAEKRLGDNLNQQHIRRKYRLLHNNQTSDDSSSNAMDLMPHPGSKESLNLTSINEGKTNNDGTTTVIENLQSEKIKNHDGQQIRRRKSKRTKSKRRRTNKRRKITTTTTEETIFN